MKIISTLDWLAWSLLDARVIADEFTAKDVSLSICRRSFNPSDFVAARSTLTGEHLATYIGA